MAKVKDQIYLHGYSSQEQARLVEQAYLFAPWVFSGMDEMDDVTQLLEVGCGVGAQTKILLEKFPHLKITSIDLSPNQLEVARLRLAKEIKQGRVNFIEANAMELENLEGEFDGAFLCWFLEHVPGPEKVLKSLKNKLTPGSPVWMREVNNSSLFVEPYSPNLLKYWFEFNDYQWIIKGQPFMGMVLGNILTQQGWSEIKTNFPDLLFDDRRPKGRKKMFKFFIELLLSGSEALKDDKRVNQELIDEMVKELEHAKASKGSVFYLNFVRAFARA